MKIRIIVYIIWKKGEYLDGKKNVYYLWIINGFNVELNEWYLN